MVIQLPPNLPVGFRFHPTDAELVTSYLKPKILGKGYDVDAIAEVNLCELEPWELPQKSKIERNNDRLWWFLCRRDYINQSSNRSKRSTKTGFWKITGKERKIKDENTKVCIGRKRTLVFHTGPTPGKRTNWVMQEIYLDPHTFTIPTQMAAYAICRLKKKTDESVETPEGEFVPNLEHQVSPPSTQSVNRETQIDREFDSGPIESQLTEDDIRWMLSDEQEGSLIAAAYTSDESPEDFADRCIVDDAFVLTDHNGTQATLKRSYFGDWPAGSDTDAEGANTQNFQTAESSGYSYSNANSKKVRQMRISKMQSETLQTSVASDQHFVEEQTVNPRKESSSHSISPVTLVQSPKRIQIQQSYPSSSSSSSSSSPVIKSAIKAKEPQEYVPRKASCVKDKEYRDNGKVGKKGSVETRLRPAASASLTSSWQSVVTFVDTSSLSISCSRSLVEYWLNVVFGSVFFLIFVRELVVFGSW